MENFETKPQSRVDNPEFIDKFIDTYASELEEMATEPKSRLTEIELNLINRFRESQKLPSSHRLFYDLLVRVGQDFRLTPDEIDILIERFLE